MSKVSKLARNSNSKMFLPYDRNPRQTLHPYFFTQKGRLHSQADGPWAHSACILSLVHLSYQVGGVEAALPTVP